jgi:hypothetical protein
MAQPLRPKSVASRVKKNTRAVHNEERKPIIPGPWVYVGDFVAPDDPGNDPPGTWFNSPPFLNDFYYVSPIAFRHGVDGQTDMIGSYDLTQGAVSGDTAFLMPLQWAMEMPPAHMFPVELDTDVWSIAVQTVDVVNLVSGKAPVKIFWPIVADPVP